MSTSEKSSRKKRHPLRKLVFLAVLSGIAAAIKNALADKGGSYEAPARPTQVPTPPAPSSAPAPAAPVTPPPTAKAKAPSTTPVVTAEDIVVQRPVENLDEFANPVAADPVDADPLDAAVAAEQPVDDAAQVEAAPTDKATKESPGKIDPFGIR